MTEYANTTDEQLKDAVTSYYIESGHTWLRVDKSTVVSSWKMGTTHNISISIRIHTPGSRVVLKNKTDPSRPNLAMGSTCPIFTGMTKEAIDRWIASPEGQFYRKHIQL